MTGRETNDLYRERESGAVMEFSDQVSAEEKNDLCLVLVGSISCGKTLTADTLLGQRSGQSSSFSSRECRVRQGVSEGRRLSILEAPRWYWSGGDVEAAIREKSQQGLGLLGPGPLVFLILIPVGEFTEMERRIPQQLRLIFGPLVLEHTLVLLTCGDYLMGRSLEQYLQRETGLQEVLRSCRGRCHVIDNRHAEERGQVSALLEKVEQMIRSDGGFRLRREESEKEAEPERRSSIRAVQMSVINKPEESDVMSEKTLVNGLQSQPLKQEETLERRPSFKLTREGALLSQMVEESELQSFINTFHHDFKQNQTVSDSSIETGSSLPELRLVLLGRSGSGKSTAGNLILGREAFELHTDDVRTAPQCCVKAKAVREHTWVTVIDTPDWFESESSVEEVKAQISSCLNMSAPGPHVFLLCVPVHQPGHFMLQALRALEIRFGLDAVRRRMLVLFTHSDRLQESEEQDVEEHIASQRPEMLELVQRCGDRYHVLRASSSTRLLEKLHQMVKEGGGGYHGCPEEMPDLQRESPQQRYSLDALKEMEEEEEVVPVTSADPPAPLCSAECPAGSSSGWMLKLLGTAGLSGAALGVFLAGAVGGAVGAVVGIVLCEAARQRLGKLKTD